MNVRDHTEPTFPLDGYGKPIKVGSIVVFSWAGNLWKGEVAAFKFVGLSPPNERKDYYFYTRAQLSVVPIREGSTRLATSQNKQVTVTNSMSCVVISEPIPKSKEKKPY